MKNASDASVRSRVIPEMIDRFLLNSVASWQCDTPHVCEGGFTTTNARSPSAHRAQNAPRLVLNGRPPACVRLRHAGVRLAGVLCATV